MAKWYADEIYVCGEDAGGRPGGEVLAICEPTSSGLFNREFGAKLAKTERDEKIRSWKHTYPEVPVYWIEVSEG